MPLFSSFGFRIKEDIYCAMLDCIDAIFMLEEHLLFSHRATKGTVNFVQCKRTQFIQVHDAASHVP